MNLAIKIWLLAFCIITCSCESRNGGSKVFQNFDPTLAVSTAGKSTDCDITLINRHVTKIIDDGYSEILWRYHSPSPVDNENILTESICSQLKKNIQKLGADIGSCDERVGSYSSHRFSYNTDDTTGGSIYVGVTKRFDGTDIEIKIIEVEQAAPCNP